MKLVASGGSGNYSGYTVSQSSLTGWTEISCYKRITTTYTDTPTIRITIAAGNPELYLGAIWTWQTSLDSANTWWWGTLWGFRVQTNGTTDNPTGNGAAGDQRYVETYYNGFNVGSQLLTPTITYSTRQIDFNGRSVDAPNSWVHNLKIYSNRLDQCSVTCV